MGRKPRKKRSSDPRNLQRRPKTASKAAESCGSSEDVPRADGVLPRPTSWTRNRAVAPAICGFLLLATVAVFGRAVRYGFVNFDDPLYVSETRQVTDGLSLQGIGWAFTAVHSDNWHPLTWLSLMLDAQWCGSAPWGYHLTNVLLHAAAAILLFLVLWRMTDDLWPAALAAAVFAVHPLRVESVVWVAERKDVLSGLFFMLTLAAYLGYVRRPFSPARYLLVVAAFALGLLAKPMLVTLPLVLLLLDYWPLGRCGAGVSPASLVPTLCVGTQFLDAPASHEILNQGSALDNGTPKHPGRAFPRGAWERGQYGRLIAEKIPLFLLAAASCVVTVAAQSHAVVPVDCIPLDARISNALVSYAAYVGQFFYPVGLAAFYPHGGHDPSAWKPIAALLGLTIVSTAAVFWRRRCPYLPVGWFWYLGMLVPVIGLVQVGEQAMADRYTYLPQIGLSVATVWGAAQLISPLPCRRWIGVGGSAVTLTILIVCAWRQTAFWRDGETLWRCALACDGRNATAHNALGAALMESKMESNSDDARRDARIDEAIDHYREALKIRPGFPDSVFRLGCALADRGHDAEAVGYLRQAVQSTPDNAVARYNLGEA